VEQREIEIFLALAEELHFGRAAERLHVSTARVSQTIRKLEARIGGQLFERTSRRVDLTPIGQQLHDDLQPAYQQIQQGVERAIAAARGIRDTLRVGFVGAPAGQFVLEVAAGFEQAHPEVDVQIRENQFGDGLELLRGAEIDMLLAVLPIRGARQSGLSSGDVLFEEDRLLAVSARHPYAGRASVSLDDVARARVLRSPPAIPDYWDEMLAPTHRPDGAEYERGPTFATVQEMLALVGAGKGSYPVPAQASEYYVRPDVAYVPIHDALPFQWRFIWPTAAETRRIRAFDRAAAALAGRRNSPAG
jgi:DNA-binding transcriptional LysR family regulator